jgi:hypothetical protein
MLTDNLFEVSFDTKFFSEGIIAILNISKDRDYSKAINTPKVVTRASMS